MNRRNSMVYLTISLLAAVAFVVFGATTGIRRGDVFTIVACAVGAAGALRLAYLARRQMPNQ